MLALMGVIAVIVSIIMVCPPTLLTPYGYQS
jgi:hypothetical protein